MRSLTTKCTVTILLTRRCAALADRNKSDRARVITSMLSTTTTTTTTTRMPTPAARPRAHSPSVSVAPRVRCSYSTRAASASTARTCCASRPTLRLPVRERVVGVRACCDRTLRRRATQSAVQWCAAECARAIREVKHSLTHTHAQTRLYLCVFVYKNDRSSATMIAMIDSTDICIGL
jgi:hypothetical protein